MEIFVSAGEASSDIHCARLVRELKSFARGAELTFFGLGGDALAAEGASLLLHNRVFSVGGGPLEVFSRLPARRRLERTLEQRLLEARPAGAILVDNGEINLRLASLLHFFDVPVVYFIPPKVWAWRLSRIEQLEQHVDLVLGILPFEEPLYKEWNVPFRYIGNPLLDEVPLDLTPEDARRKLGLEPDARVLTVMPGSRQHEISYHAGVFSDGIRLFLERLPVSEPKPVVLIPAAQTIDPDLLAAEFGGRLAPIGATVRVVGGVRSHECLRAATAALVKSGTSTLEAALLETPMVLAYKSSRSSEWLFRHVVRYRGFLGLVNLFLARSPESALGWGSPETPVVPEVVLGGCTPERIADELGRVYRDGPDRERMLEQLARTRALLRPPAGLGDSPLRAAAAAAWKVFDAHRGKEANDVA